MSVSLAAVAEREHDDFFAMFERYSLELAPYDPFGPEAFDLPQYRRAVLADMEGRELLWIVEGGERAGFAMVRTSPDWPDASRSIASIVEFYVLPERRRAGAGRAAVEALLAEHRRRGTALVEAAVLRDNEGAKAFWAALGFDVQFLQTARRP